MSFSFVQTNGVSFQGRPVLGSLLSKSNEGERLRPVLHDSVKWGPNASPAQPAAEAALHSCMLLL